jgi:hypothetical protein
MAATNPLTTAGFNGDSFPSSVYPQLISAIVGSNAFANSLTSGTSWRCGTRASSVWRCRCRRPASAS